MTELAPDETAVARSRTYLLLGRLFLRGVTDDILPHVQAVPPLAEALTSFTPPGADAPDLEEAAVAHEETFGFNVFPFQSTFLDETARAGGRETRRVTDFYREAGFPIVQTAESTDHVGVELHALAFLSKMEADNDRDGSEAERARGLSRRFLDEHLLRWFPALFRALVVHGEPFFRNVAALTQELLVEHRRALGSSREGSGSRTASHNDLAPGAAEPSGAELLEDPDTRLRDIGEYLLIPATSGIFLSRAAIRHLSHREHLPAGFGARSDMMGNLLQSAADYGGLDGLVGDLRAHVEGARRRWRSFAGEIPGRTDPIAESWIGRLDATEQLLEKLGRAQQRIQT